MTQWVKRLFSNISLRKLAVSTVGLLTLMGILIFATYEATKQSVTVEVNDEVRTVYTHASTVGEVLEEQEIQLNDHDYIEPSENTPITEEMNIVYKQAQKVFVTLDGEKEEVWTVADTVQEFMEQLRIEVKDHDQMNPSLDSLIVDNMNIDHQRAIMVTVISDGEEKEVWTTSTTVADFLANENITLDELDRVEPSVEELITEKMDIKVVRVEKVTDVVEENIDYATVKKNDSSLEQGKEQVVESGQEGRIKKYYEVVLEDGEEVSRELVKEEEVQKTKDRVVAVGTKQLTPTVSRSSSKLDTGEWRTFTATAYTANCNGCSGTTA